VDKDSLRAQFKLRINQLSKMNKWDQSRAIVARLNPFLKDQSGVWTLFSPLIDEPNLKPLLSLCPHIQWAFPVVVSKTEMVFKPLNGSDQWVTSSWGLEEPIDGECLPPEQMRGVIAPGLAFDRQGHRLGRGGGYYDRFLSKFKGLKLGVTFNEALSEGALPSEPHDQLMDIIVSPQEWVDIHKSEVSYGF
jgi:5-formyltetrahydrofolate cyclo-ligase